MRTPALQGFLGALVLAVSTPLLAQWGRGIPTTVTDSGPAVTRPDSPEEFGIQDQSIWVVQSSGFLPFDGAVSYEYVGEGYRSATGAPGIGSFDASVQLPSGALITRIELEACDTSASAQLLLLLFACTNPALACNNILTLQTGQAATPGCNYFFIDPGAPIEVNNYSVDYFLRISDGDGDISTRYRSARIYYRRQVSPAPLMATFPTDVPVSHPYFRFVEALADAGITAGCAPNTFCVNNPITRGEMAVFLAAALGLHFPL